MNDSNKPSSILDARCCNNCKFQAEEFGLAVCMHSKSGFAQKYEINGTEKFRTQQHSCTFMLSHACGPTYSLHMRKEGD